MAEQLRIGIWAAVSSVSQATDEKVSLADQERRGREFATEHGGQVVALYTVPGHTRNIWRWDEAEESMPAYRDLRRDVEARRLDVLHCVDVDRLGRDPALSQAVVSLCERYDCEVYSAATPHVIGQRTTGQQYVEAIQRVRAREEVEHLRRRFRMGMAGRIRRGLVSNSSWPLGYTVIRSTSGRVVRAELNDDADTVREVTRLFLLGLSYREIIRRMDDAGWVTPHGGPWYASLVQRWMNNDAYAGLPSWGGVEADHPSDVYPALWDEATHRAVLQERAARRQNPRRQTRGTPYLGIALCRRCGCNMVRASSHRRSGPPVLYLRCGTHARSYHTVGDVEPCHYNAIKESTVRDAVIAVLLEVVDLDDLRARLAEPLVDDAQAEIVRVQGLLDAIRVERRRLAEALALGQMDRDIYVASDVPRQERAERLRLRLAELTNTQQQIVPVADRWSSVEELRALATAGWDQVEAPRMNAMLRRVGLRLWIEEGQIMGAEIV